MALRRKGWFAWLLLAASVLGLAGAAASALASNACCRDMHGASGGSCEAIGSAPCCGGPLAAHATTPLPAAPSSLVAAPAPDPAQGACFALRRGAEAPRARADTLRIRSVVLRL